MLWCSMLVLKQDWFPWLHILNVRPFDLVLWNFHLEVCCWSLLSVRKMEPLCLASKQSDSTFRFKLTYTCHYSASNPATASHLLTGGGQSYSRWQMIFWPKVSASNNQTLWCSCCPQSSTCTAGDAFSPAGRDSGAQIPFLDAALRALHAVSQCYPSVTSLLKPI